MRAGLLLCAALGLAGCAPRGAGMRAAAPATAPPAATSAAPDDGPYEVEAIRYGFLDQFPVAALVAGADTTRAEDIALMVWLARQPGGRVVLMDAGFYRDRIVAVFDRFTAPGNGVARIQ